MTVTFPRIVDNDCDEITATLEGVEIRGWSYSTAEERRWKMLMAHEFAEGWYQATQNSHSGNSPCAGQQAHKEGGPSTGVDNPKCLEIGGGGVSENDAAPILRRIEAARKEIEDGARPKDGRFSLKGGDANKSGADNGKPDAEHNNAPPQAEQSATLGARCVVLTYSGAKVISAYTHIEIELTQGPGRHGLVGELRKGRWVRSAERIWSRENDVAAIASARDILGRFYGEPAQ